MRHSTDNAATRAGFDPAGYSLSGFFLAQLAVGTLGVVIITSEYQTGSIRATLAATPQRAVVRTAKAAVFAAVAGLTGIIASLVSFLVGQRIMAQKHLQTHLGDPAALRSILGAGLPGRPRAARAWPGDAHPPHRRRHRHRRRADPHPARPRPGPPRHLAGHHHQVPARYLPLSAGQAVIGHTKFIPPGHQLTLWTGLGLFCAYTAAILIVAVIALNRRDA